MESIYIAMRGMYSSVEGCVTEQGGLTLHGDLPTVVAAVHIILLLNKKWQSQTQNTIVMTVQ